MYFFMRVVRPLLEQTWATRASAVLSLLGFAGALISWARDGSYTFRFLMFGVVWAIVGAGAWAINR